MFLSFHGSGGIFIPAIVRSRRVDTGTFAEVISFSRTLKVLAMEGSNGAAQFDSKRSYQVVVAATRDLGIGKDGTLPWKLPSDLKFFKQITVTTSDPTKRNAVIMGRKTWESIPSRYRPLPGRLNVVLTRSGSFDITTSENILVCGSMDSALEILSTAPYCLFIEKVFVIGGGSVLR